MADSHATDDAHAGGHGHHPPARPFSRLLALLRPERRELFAAVLLAAAIAILSLASPVAVEALVNTVAFGYLLWPVLIISAVLCACLVLAGIIRAVHVYIVELVQRRLFVRIVAQYAHRFPRLQLDALGHTYPPELANRFFDTMNLQKTLASLLLDGLSLIVTTVVGLTVLAFYHPFLIGFDFILLLLIAFTLFVLGWGGVRTSLNESHAKYDVAGWLEELVRSPLTFKFGGGPKYAFARADQLAGEYVTARRAHFAVVWRQTVFALLLQVVASTALLSIGGYLVINRGLTLGQLVAAELIVSLVVASVAKLGKYTESFYDLMSAAEKLGLLSDLPIEREGGETLPSGPTGMTVRLRGIDRVLSTSSSNLPDWQIASNERVGLVGQPGSGKSLLFEVLCGLRDQGKATVEFDGVDLRSLSLEKLREQVSFVAGSDVFLGTVLENVRVGREHLTAEEVREALRFVNLLDTVHRLPQGLETPITPAGGTLSATQAVRLTLARGIVGRPRLLILDATLDSVDLDERSDLLARLFDKQNPWTLLVASAEAAVLQRCDRVIQLSPVPLLEYAT